MRLFGKGLIGYSLMRLIVDSVIWEICENQFNPLNLWLKNLSTYVSAKKESRIGSI